MRIKIIALLATTLICLLLYFIFKPDTLQEGVTLAPVKQQADEPEPEKKSASKTWQPPHLTANDYTSQYGPLPASLRDTRIPFDLKVDDQNHLIVESTLRRLFDYFFTLVGEEDVEKIKQRIAEILQQHLPEPASSEALTIFHEYVTLKEAELALRSQLAADYKASGTAVDLQERVRLLRELRQSTLSPTVYDAFYGEEDKRAEYSLQRHAILKNDSLSLEERNAALRTLDQQLPESLRREKEQEYRYEELQQQILQGRENGLSEADIFQLRSEAYGPEAAERFSEADQQQAAWDQRVETYRQQRRAILDSGLSQADQQAEIERLREQHFSGPELLRIPVIDRMYDEENRP